MLNTAMAMVIIIGITASLVASPMITSIGAKNSAKITSIREKVLPILKGSGKVSDFVPKLISLGRPCVIIIALKAKRYINNAILAGVECFPGLKMAFFIERLLAKVVKTNLGFHPL